MARYKEILSRLSLKEKIYETMIMRSEKYLYDDEAAKRSRKSLSEAFSSVKR